MTLFTFFGIAVYVACAFGTVVANLASRPLSLWTLPVPPGSRIEPGQDVDIPLGSGYRRMRVLNLTKGGGDLVGIDLKDQEAQTLKAMLAGMLWPMYWPVYGLWRLATFKMTDTAKRMNHPRPKGHATQLPECMRAHSWND